MRQAFVVAALCCASLAQAQLPPSRPVHLTQPNGMGTGFPGPSSRDTDRSLPQRPALSAAGTVSPTAQSAPPRAAKPEQLISFDPRHVELAWHDNRWQLVADGVVLKDFGQRQAEGREVLRLVREQGLTQLGTVGSSLPVMEYWLVDGQAPRGLVTGVRPMPLNLPLLKVEEVESQVGKSWCLRDGPRILFSFGSNAAEAEQALAVIRRYGFTHLAYIGKTPPATMLFVSNPDNTTSRPFATPASFTSRTSTPGSPTTAPVLPGGAEGPSGPPTTSRNNPVVPDELPQGRQFGATGLRPDLENLPDHVTFDWRQVQVRHEGSDWKLVYGTRTLANFGPNERDARQALAAMQFYRFNQQWWVGQPSPVFSYFLVSGRAPQGMMLGLNRVSFRPEKLVVRQEGNRWVIADSHRTIIDFGEHKEEARQMLQTIQRLRFDSLCRIGRSGHEAMTFLVRAQ